MYEQAAHSNTVYGSLTAVRGVHYGYASLNPVSRIPAYCVLPKLDLDVQAAGTWVGRQLAKEAAAEANSSSSAEQDQQQQQQQHGQPDVADHPVWVVCCDQGYLHLWPQLQQVIREAAGLVSPKTSANPLP